MWFAIAWLTLLPLAWAVAGAPDIAGIAPLDWSVLPAWLTEAAPVSTQALVVSALLGVVLALGPTRKMVVHVGTVVHEVGHGITAAALGGVVNRITMAPDGSGQATTGLPKRARLRGSLVTLSGYLAPGIVGLASLQMAVVGQGVAWFGFLTLVSVVMLLLTMRSSWAILVSVLSVAAGWLLVGHAPAWLATAASAVLAGLLLARGVADAANQHRAARTGARTDAGSLARQTGLPVGLFSRLHQLLALSLAGAGIWLALPMLH